MTTPMLKQLAPIAVIPPSPKNRAWMMSAIDTARPPISGPSRMAARVAPTAWPVVPPGSGTLNIMMMNEKAAMRAIIGTLRALTRVRSACSPRHQKGITSA